MALARIGWGIKSASFSCCYVHNRYIAYIFLLFAKFAPSRPRRPCRLLFDASTSWRRYIGNERQVWWSVGGQDLYKTHNNIRHMQHTQTRFFPSFVLFSAVERSRTGMSVDHMVAISRYTSVTRLSSTSASLGRPVAVGI